MHKTIQEIEEGTFEDGLSELFNNAYFCTSDMWEALWVQPLAANEDVS
jgi:hypothetical protein